MFLKFYGSHGLFVHFKTTLKHLQLSFLLVVELADSLVYSKKKFSE